ncbi:uncharacterized protein [Malus domestica]|uniref:uncharacterized protein isoform X4 n=1 Tax=Malus domestica TaxID=3750 RepID=UPI0039752CA4
MADYSPLLTAYDGPGTASPKPPRVASLDVFRGLCVFLMMLVDYGGSILPIIAHSPWNGLHLADFVMPFFLFIAGVSLALVYKRVTNRVEATWKAVFKAVKLFLLGVLLQGGYFHGVASLTYGVDIERIRWFGILQRIAIGYIAAALCEIWLSRQTLGEVGFFRTYYWHWCVIFSLSAIYAGLLYGLYVPDWEFKASTPSSLPPSNATTTYVVKCSVRGDLGPACNSARMIDRYILGFDHLYLKPVYRNLKECNVSADGRVPESSPSWCHTPFDPEAAVTCIIGLQYGHILAHIQVDVYGYRCMTYVLEWMGIHSLTIFVVVTSNLAVIAIQGFYLADPQNNIVHWIITRFVHN